MLVSYLVLPAQKTRSHYLSVCLILSVMMITLGFTIPLAASAEQCYDEITPNDMYTSHECAWSGAFIVAGGLCATMWVFLRALSMNLQICWDIVPGAKFFYFSQGFGWGIPAALFTATMSVTGVSFRFGGSCHVNHEKSMADFWGPLLTLAGGAGVLQLMTFGYCIHVYLKNLWSDQAQQSESNASSSGLPSYTNSVRTQTARAVYQRLKKVLWLQWRGILIVSIILVDVIFFSIVFVYLDGLQSAVKKDFTKVEPWLLCLALHPTNKEACLHLVDEWLVSESTVVAVLLLLSLAGVQVFLFLTRPSIFGAWVEFFRIKFSPGRQEFVSLDARPEAMRTQSKQELLRYERGHQSTTFEMQKPSPTQLRDMNLALDMKTLSPTQTVLSTPDEIYRSPYNDTHDMPNDFESRRSISPELPSMPVRTRFPPEYAGRMTPDARPASPNAAFTPLSPTYCSFSGQAADYFPRNPSSLAQQQQQRRGYTRASSSSSAPGGVVDLQSGSRRASQDRKYTAPQSSFSVPKTPSRNSSMKSVTFDPRDGHARGGLGLNPPSEAGESQEDLTMGGQKEVRGQSLDRR